MGMEKIYNFMIAALQALLLETKAFIAHVLLYSCCCMVRENNGLLNVR